MRALKMPAIMMIATMKIGTICPLVISSPLGSAGRLSRPVPQSLDLALEAVFLLDRDPLDHLQPFLELPDLVAQPRGLGIVFGHDRVAVAAAAAPAQGRPQ